MPKPRTTTRTHRFYCPQLAEVSEADVSDVLCTLDRDESHHARRVLRLSAGDAVELFDGQGGLAFGTIDGYDGKTARCRLNSLERHHPLTPTLTVASAVPKGPRADAMTDQLSQLGVDRFIPLHAEHSVAVPRPGKVEKFSRGAVESAKQCGRLWLMRVDEPMTLDQVLAEPGHDLKLIASPDAQALPDVDQRIQHSRGVLVLIGPEGGFSDTEQAVAVRAGCVPWSIAPHVLRIETAAVTAAAVLRYHATPAV